MYCKKCGYSLNDGDKKCSFCGAKVEEETAPETTEFMNTQKKVEHCKKCGYSLKEGDQKCPFCGSEVQEQVRPEPTPIINTQNKVIYCKKCGCKLDSVDGTCKYCDSSKSHKVDETTMKELRNASGFIHLKTQWWHHLLIACGGYLLMEVLFTIIGSIMIGLYRSKGYDFTCILDDTCASETLLVYTKITAVCQVLCELIIIASIALIFIKYIKTFFLEARDRNTWKWYGLGLAILYGGNFIYSSFLNAIQFGTADSANQAAVNEVIFSNPLFGLLFVVIAAPIFEELIFRFGLFRIFTNKGKAMEIVGIVVTTLLFAGIHMIATFTEAFAAPDGVDTQLIVQDFVGSFPIYLIGAFALTFTYYKSKNLIASIFVHMTVNFISFLAILALSGNTIETIINLFTRLLF